MSSRRMRHAYVSMGYMLACGLLWSAQARSQPVGIVDRPCPSSVLPPPAFRQRVVALLIEPHTIEPDELDRFKKSPEVEKADEANRQRAAQDWADLCRYRALDASARASLMPPRVVFMGDSITENWGLADPAFFDGKVANRGISGQTTAQMLVRFRADVVALRPQNVHILAGTNDVAGNAGPMAAQDFRSNIMSMVDLARANGIAVVLGSIPPAAAFGWRPEVKPVATIKALDEWLRKYSASQHIRFVDYYSALAGPAGEFRSDLSNDGVHPNRKGYEIMRRLAEDALSSPAR